MITIGTVRSRKEYTTLDQEMCENIQNCCRICLDVESDHIPIVSNITINLHLKSCLAMNISATDGLPKTICVSCASQLSEFYNFQLNARCSQDWLESSIQEITKKSTETKVAIQPLPDSEYNSDSLLEFLNNTANIEEYLNNLGKEDIPSIVSMLDRNQENSTDSFSKPNNKTTKVLSPKKRDTTKVKHKVNMEIDVLDSDIDIVKEILMKETEPKKTPKKPLQHLSLSDLKQTTKQKMLIHSLTRKSLKNSDPQAEKLKTAKEKSAFTCFACKSKYDQLEKLSQHLSVCDSALRTCIHCNLSFESKLKMRQHSLIHSKSPVTCLCGKQFNSKDKYTQHHETCIKEPGMTGCMYRCKQCGETFTERFELYKHAKEHVIIASERICDICGHGFIGNEALVKHRHDTHGKSDDLMYRFVIHFINILM